MTKKETVQKEMPQAPTNVPGGINIPGLPAGMSQDQMAKLIAAMQQQQIQAQPKYKQGLMKLMQYITPKLQSAVHNLDRFVNFVTQPSDRDRNDVVQAARSPILFGTYVIIIFFVFGGIWASIAPLDSASAVMGTVISSTNKKVLQAPDNATVKEILVKQGDHVRAGDTLVTFDETRFKTNHDAVLSQYRSLKAAESRLIAERDNLTHINFSPELLKDAEKSEVAQILETQRHIFNSKRELITNVENHTNQRIEQTHKNIEGLKEKKKSSEKQYEMMDERLKSAKSLFAKGIIHKAALMEIESKYTDTKSNNLATDAEIIRNEQEVSRLKIELMEKQSEMFTRTLSELKETQMHLSEAREKYVQAKDALDKTILTAPVDGTVSIVHVKTTGTVVGAGTPIVEVSPDKDFLVVEAKISPKQIGYIHAGLNAKLRFSAFKSRTTPVFNGTVMSVSPDAIEERSPNPQTGESTYYAARIEIDMDEFNKEAKRLDLKLIPGMQSEIQITTGTRTLLRYLLDPITDNMFKAFKEK